MCLFHVLFSELIQVLGTPSVMLDTQYRMHPGISNFPSKEFYKGTVRDGTVDADGNVRPGLHPPRSQYLEAIKMPDGKRAEPSVIFLHHEGKETSRDRSRVNHSEARIIAQLVVDLLLRNPVR